MHEPVLISLAAEHALIDVDSTILIQAVIFAIMGFAATRLLFRPYLKMRDERAAGIEGARAEAERMSAEAEARLADYEHKLEAARAKAHLEQRAIRAEATAHESEVTNKARAEAQKALDAARGTIRTELESARSELMPRADELAREMASKLLGREVTR